MPHDHGHGDGNGGAHGHNHGSSGHHLHSHMAEDDAGEAIRALAAQFIEGFVSATDKAAFLRLAGVPLEIADPDGGPALKLVDIALTTEWQVGTASPAFGSRELAWMPFPGDLVRERTNMAFVYVSLQKKIARDLRDFLAAVHAVPGGIGEAASVDVNRAQVFTRC
ncbi:MAG: hypothetical protein AAF074_16530 [Pseudomonadota bacterium]